MDLYDQLRSLQNAEVLASRATGATDAIMGSVAVPDLALVGIIAEQIRGVVASASDQELLTAYYRSSLDNEGLNSNVVDEELRKRKLI